jgi:hypothetical protein
MRWILATLFCLAANPSQASRRYFLMIGPMAHYNFGSSEKGVWSFGLEASYWGMDRSPLAFDIGMECDTRGQVRLYAEGEMGLGLAGMAFGPVAEFGRRRSRLGIQGSVWANYFLGTDYRLRKLWGASLERAAGAYLKIPAHAPSFSDEPIY